MQKLQFVFRMRDFLELFLLQHLRQEVALRAESHSLAANQEIKVHKTAGGGGEPPEGPSTQASPLLQRTENGKQSLTKITF